MGMFRRTDKPFDRGKALDVASKARAKGNLKKAIAAYREVLAVKADDLDVHLKLAPLLAEIRQVDAAWESFVVAGEGFSKRGFADKAASVYRQAGQLVPTRAEVWERLCDICLERERRADAAKTLADAVAKHFKKPAQRADAIRLLRKGLAIEPNSFRFAFGLGRLLRKEGQHDEAQALLEGLVATSSRAELTKVRGELLRLAPTPAALWRFARALLAGR